MSFNSDYMDKLEEHRVELVGLRPQIFIDELRSRSVLTQNDGQQILNDARHPTVASKMGEMLDILRSKGPRGYKMFIEVLSSENPTLYKKITGQDAPVMPIRDIHKECRCGNIFNLEQLTEALRRKSQLETDLHKLKTTNNKLISERRSTNEKLKILWEQYNIEMDKNKDRDRLEAERNDMMEQLTNVTAKALSYKEDLEVVKRDLHKLRREQLVDRQDLEKARKGLHQQRQRSMQIEHNKMRIREELQEKVDQLQDELRKIDKNQQKRISVPVSSTFASDVTSAPINQQLVNLQTDLEIVTQDWQQAVLKAEESAERAFSVTKELHQVEEQLEQMEKENEDLQDSLDMKQDEIEMQKSFVILAEEGRSQAIAERDQALEEKKVQTEKCALLMLQRDKLFDDQRILRSKLETLMNNNSTLSSQVVKYKKKFRGIQHQQDSIESSSGDDSTKAKYTLQSGDSVEDAAMKTVISESSDSTNKRDSTTTTSSSSPGTSMVGHSHSRDSEDSGDQSSLDQPPREFRRRTTPVSSKGHSPQPRKCTRDMFSEVDFPHASLPESDEEGETSAFGPMFPRRPFTDSTRVQVNGDSIRRRELLLGSYSMNQGSQRVVKRGKKKDKKYTGLKRRSKSFNDIANLTFDEDDTSLDLELASKEKGSSRPSKKEMTDRSLSLIKWFTLQKINQRRRADLQAAMRSVPSSDDHF